MPTGMTFTSLQQDIRRYIERGFSPLSDPLVYDQLPRLINDAERRCALELKIQGYQTPMFDVLQAGVSVIDKPNLWKQTVSVNIGTGAGMAKHTFLYPRTYEYCRNYWPDEAQRAQPLYYADYDAQHWLLAPTPDQAYPIEIISYIEPPLLDDTTTTNWLTDYAPTLLLYASLWEAGVFLRNDSLKADAQQQYDRAMAATNGEDMQKILDRTITRRSA